MTDTAVTTSQNNLPTKTLAELKVEIKFHLGQMAGHAVEIGKLLIQAKSQVGHGNFGKWIEENFNLKERSAQNFMAIAERFSNTQTFADLGYSQMLTMLALPEGEEENFIAEKAAEGNAVEDMTIKTLRDEIKEWKRKFEEADRERESNEAVRDVLKSNLEKAELEKEQFRTSNYLLEKKIEITENENKKLQAEKNQLEKDNADLTKQRDGVMEHSAEIQGEIEELKMQLEYQEPIEKIVEPEDYEPLKKERDDLQNQIAELEKKLADKIIEVEDLLIMRKIKSS